MKTSLTYGFLMALGGAVLLLLMFFAGMQESVEKMQSAQWAQYIGGLAIAITCLSLAMREKRASSSPDAPWSYGSALGGGVLTALWGALFSAVFTYIYFAIINPNLPDVLLQMQLTKMEGRGMNANAESMMRKMFTAPVLTAFQTFFGFLWGLFLSLIVAIFFRQRRVMATDASVPPLVG